MKFHKIKNVPKSVCTAEQKIAYNIAQSSCGIAKNMTIHEFLQYAVSVVQGSPTLAKYDIDSIIHCLRQGIIPYAKANFPIYATYKEIGKAFPTLYPVE